MKDHVGRPASGDSGPVRTMKVGERVIVSTGELEIVSIDGRRVTVRLHPASSPPPPIMFPAK